MTLMIPRRCGAHVAAAATPYGVRVDCFGESFYVTVAGEPLLWLGRMTRDAALGRYLALRDVWLSGYCQGLAA